MIQKLFRQMSRVQIISAMTTTLCLLIDSIVIGRFVGVDGMSAYGIATPLLIIISAVATMLISGVQVTLGKSMGFGDRRGANACYSSSIILSLALAGAGMLLIFLAGGPVSTMLGSGSPGAENAVYTMTVDYLRGYILGAPFFFLSQIMTAYFQVVGKRKLMLSSVIVMTVADVIGDLLSVFVFHGGMFGIGLASSASYLAAFAVGIVFFLKKDCPFRFRRKGIRIRVVWSILRSGSPVMVNQVFYTLRVFLCNQILLGLAGNPAVATFAVFSTISNLLYSVGFGTGSVTLMLTTIFFSEQDRRSLRELVREMIHHPLTLITVVALAVLVASPLVIRLFVGDDPTVTAIAVPGLRIFVLSLLPSILNNVFKNYFQGVGHTGITNLISFLESLGISIPCLWLASRLFGLTGFWIGLDLGLALTLVAILIIVWRKNGKIAMNYEAFSYLDKDFGAKPEDCLELTVLDRAQAVEASRQLCEFCRDKGLDRRSAMLIGLCVEEMTVNVIEHGFHQTRHAAAVDVRLVVQPEQRIIRIRDNCPSFDPTKFFELHRNDDPAAHIGLRMVMGMVKEANYINSLGLNNLTLTL